MSLVVLVGDLCRGRRRSIADKGSRQPCCNDGSPDPPVSSLPAPSSPDGTVIAPAPTIDYPMSTCCCPRTSRNPTQHRSWRFTLVSTLQCGRGNDTPVASQVINHQTISRVPFSCQNSTVTAADPDSILFCGRLPI